MSTRPHLVGTILLLGLLGPAAAEYQPVDGPGSVATVENIRVAVRGEERDLGLSAVYPAAPGPRPLVVFSHGGFCSNSDYQEIVHYWAARGYVVMMPSHPDAPSGGMTDRSDMIPVFETRIRDMSLMLDRLDEIREKAPVLGGRIDTQRVAAAGHSMGALTASVVAGLQLTGPDGGTRDLRDPRFKVALLLNGPGPMAPIAERGWAGLTLPLLVSTGTADQAQMAGPGATWEWRLSTYGLSPPGDKFALVVERADHFLGGWLCKRQASADAVPDVEALHAVQEVSTAFLDAYLKNADRGAIFLESAAREPLADGRAVLRRR